MNLNIQNIDKIGMKKLLERLLVRIYWTQSAP